jgi:hypothetical protein
LNTGRVPRVPAGRTRTRAGPLQRLETDIRTCGQRVEGSSRPLSHNAGRDHADLRKTRRGLGRARCRPRGGVVDFRTARRASNPAMAQVEPQASRCRGPSHMSSIVALAAPSRTRPSNVDVPLFSGDRGDAVIDGRSWAGAKSRSWRQKPARELIDFEELAIWEIMGRVRRKLHAAHVSAAGSLLTSGRTQSRPGHRTRLYHQGETQPDAPPRPNFERYAATGNRLTSAASSSK